MINVDDKTIVSGIWFWLHKYILFVLINCRLYHIIHYVLFYTFQCRTVLWFINYKCNVMVFKIKRFITGGSLFKKHPNTFLNLKSTFQNHSFISKHKRHLPFSTNAWRLKWPCNIHAVFRTDMCCEFKIRSPCVYMCTRECWRTKTGIHSFAQLSTDNSTNTHRKKHRTCVAVFECVISSSRESASVFKSATNRSVSALMARRI